MWSYASINSFGGKGEEKNLLALHPTVKPVALLSDAIVDCTARHDIVLDVFLGSGSTILAAERTGRSCYGMEIDPYVCRYGYPALAKPYARSRAPCCNWSLF